MECTTGCRVRAADGGVAGAGLVRTDNLSDGLGE